MTSLSSARTLHAHRAAERERRQRPGEPVDDGAARGVGDLDGRRPAGDGVGDVGLDARAAARPRLAVDAGRADRRRRVGREDLRPGRLGGEGQVLGELEPGIAVGSRGRPPKLALNVKPDRHRRRRRRRRCGPGAGRPACTRRLRRASRRSC